MSGKRGKPVGGGGARNPRSLANLRQNHGRRNENLIPGAGAWEPGTAPQLSHGARTRRPQGSPEWSPAVRAAIADLEERVGSELRDAAGGLHPWALPSIEAVAIQRVAAWRVERWVDDREARGVARGEDFDLQSRVGERYHRALDREALTLRSRIEARGGALDLARALAELPEEGRGGG